MCSKQVKWEGNIQYLVWPNIGCSLSTGLKAHHKHFLSFSTGFSSFWRGYRFLHGGKFTLPMTICVLLMAWKLHRSLYLCQHLLTECGLQLTRLLTAYTSKTTRTLIVKGNMIQPSSRNNYQIWTQWQQSWHLFGRLVSKKKLCSMPKTHHLFFPHRIVIYRNLYTVACYKRGLKPFLPKVRPTQTN